jgi:hypothetical protein
MASAQLPPAVEALWQELQSVRAELLKEAEGLSQAQADWRPSPTDWSAGEIIHHLTIAETHTGKLTTRLTREAQEGGMLRPFPQDLGAFTPLPPAPPGPAEAPPLVRPEHGHSIGQLLADMKATRERSRQSVERLASLDPRPLKFKHFQLGDLDLAQWWLLQARHDRTHLAQLRAVKAAPGFPRE